MQSAVQQSAAQGRYSRTRGYTHYELSNHLGNVLAVITDRKLIGTGAFYVSDVLMLTDYYAFGMEMPDRSYNAGSYRYGYNGKEKSDELHGEGNAYDFGARINDVRSGRFLSIDPLRGKFPSESNYIFAGNNPILNIDIEAKFKLPQNIIDKYPTFASYVQNNLKGDLLKLPNYKDVVRMYAGVVTDEQFNEELSWNTGATIDVRAYGVNANIDVNTTYERQGGEYLHSNNTIYLEEKMIAAFENAPNPETKLGALLVIFGDITHEATHRLDYLDGKTYKDNDAKGVVKSGEPGYDVFQDIFWGVVDKLTPRVEIPLRKRIININWAKSLSTRLKDSKNEAANKILPTLPTESFKKDNQESEKKKNAPKTESKSHGKKHKK